MSLPRFGGKRWCWNKALRIDQTDAAVWQEVCCLLEEPQRLEQEYRRRLQSPSKPNEQEGLDTQMGKLRRGLARLIDSYAEGLIDKQEFEPRVTRMRERLRHLEEQLQHLKEKAEEEEELRAILGHLETFAAKVKNGLCEADFPTRRDIIRALVKRVEIAEQQISVVFRVSPISPALPFDGASPNLQHWGRRVDTGTLHRHGLAALGFEPISQPEEIGHHRTERLDLLVHSLCGDEEETGHDHLLVNINPATAVIHDLHRFLAFRIRVLVDEPCQVGDQEQRESSGCFSAVRATFGGA
jgi:hypothetical protein